MSTWTDSSRNESTYVIDAENAAEMARLTRQDRLITKTMGGLFPERSDLSGVRYPGCRLWPWRLGARRGTYISPGAGDGLR